MEYKKGFKIKPDRVDEAGRVYFTDGTNEVNPNQISCEAYGYKYNKFSNTCSIDSLSFNLSKEFNSDKNSLKGINNKIESKVTNVTLNGNNSIGFLKGVIIGASEGLGVKYTAEFRCSVQKNSSNVANVSHFTLDTPIVDSIGNVNVSFVDGNQANSDTSSSLYDAGEVYSVVAQDLLSGSGATKNVTWSISINLVEQIHDLNTNLTTNN